MTTRIITGDALSSLRELPGGSVHCVVTSPPYWGLRAYGGDPGMIGLEPTFEEHLDNLVAVFREVRRVLRADGTLWLNYGDAYAGSWGAQSRGAGDPNGTSSLSGGQIHAAPKETHKGSLKRVPCGLKPKDLMLMPARVALALQADGWWLRSEIVWHKPNPMPESTRDRPTSAHEKLFLFAKSSRYFYDTEAVREVGQSGASDVKKMVEGKERIGGKHKHLDDPLSRASCATNIGRKRSVGSPGHRNHRNVWTIATAPYKGAHFATFPPALVEPCIKAGTSAKGACMACGAPWVRQTKATYRPREDMTYVRKYGGNGELDESSGWRGFPDLRKTTETLGWSPTCQCDAGVAPCVVLDPFAGSGTVGLVADQLGRHAILIEINPDYAEMARRRIEGDAPLLSAVAAE